MSIVFVHGVNNRKEDPDYEPRRLVTQRFLERYLAGITLNGRSIGEVRTRFPYWGDLATRFAWGMKSLPSRRIDALGAPGVEDGLRPLVAIVRDALDDPQRAEDQPLLSLARRAFGAAVDVVSELVILDAPAAQHDAAARFIVTAQIYAQSQPKPAWVVPLTTDEQFVARLVQEVKTADAAAPAPQALGVLDPIANTVAAGAAKLKQATKAAANNVLDLVGDFASTKVLGWTRNPLNATLGRFFGDVFVYMDSRGTAAKPGPIPARILGECSNAITATPGEPLIVIGHSLGGVISFDLLSYFCPDIVVDLFVTVGSQVSQFEEMKLFRASDAHIPSASVPKAPRPANIKHWINVLDEVDIFSYACAPVFEGVHDLEYDTHTYVIKAHGAYFLQARFYERLRARILELQVA
jgi:hypothetical protein